MFKLTHKEKVEIINQTFPNPKDKIREDDDLEWVYNDCEFNAYPRKYPLPSLDTIFPVQRNPFDKSPLNYKFLEWLLECSSMAVDKFVRVSKSMTFAPLVFPTCTDINRYETAVKAMAMFFILDDHTETDWGDVHRDTDQCRQVWGQFDAALDKLLQIDTIPMHQWKPYILGYYAVFQETVKDFNEIQKKRFVYSWKYYSQGNIEETEFINSGAEYKDVDQMLEVRMKTIGLRPTVQFLEYTEQLFVPEEDWVDQTLQETLDLMAKSIISINDFYSFEKELLANNGNLNQMYNMVALMVRKDRLSIQQGFQKMVEFNTKFEHKIRDNINKILLNPEFKADTKEFVRKLELMMGGNWKFHQICDRYHKYNIEMDGYGGNV